MQIYSCSTRQRTDLDSDSLQTLENALADYDGAVLFVTHDRFLIGKISATLVAFDPRTSTFERFEGDYDFYLTCKKKQDALRAESESQTRKADAQKQTASQQRAVKAKKLSFQEKKEFENIENVILEREAEKEDIENQIANPETYKQPNKAKELNIQLEALNKQIDMLYTRWEYLSRVAQGLVFDE